VPFSFISKLILPIAHHSFSHGLHLRAHGGDHICFIRVHLECRFAALAQLTFNSSSKIKTLHSYGFDEHPQSEEEVQLKRIFSDTARAILAKHIIAAAKDGERDDGGYETAVNRAHPTLQPNLASGLSRERVERRLALALRCCGVAGEKATAWSRTPAPSISSSAIPPLGAKMLLPSSSCSLSSAF
jgi:hypothetical protein